MKGLIPIAKVVLSEAEINAAVEVLKSGRLRQGEKTEQFEKAFAEKVGAKHAIAVSSGAAALHVAYAATLRPGDEVLVPSFSHISTGSMVHFTGGKPIFCDIDPRTFCIDLEDATRRLTPKTKAIAPVHLFGNACDIDGIIAFAKKHNLKIIWDAAQAHGTRYKGQDVGSFDDLVCYSFYPTKNMITGEGGMITTNDSALAEKCDLLHNHGQTGKYYHPVLGFNYRMTEVEAAIGGEQLKKLDGFVRRRRENAAYLTEKLSALKGIITPYVPQGVDHSYHQYSILLDGQALHCARDEFAKALEQEGIGTGVHYPRPLHKQPAFEALLGKTSLPVSEDVSQHILSLPVHPLLQSGDLKTIIGGLSKVVATLSE